MAITTVTIEQASPSVGGSARIITGDVTGPAGRTVTIEVTANEGYEFERFEIVEQLLTNFVMVGAHSPNNVASACTLTLTTTPLWYTPGVAGYYTDQAGTIPAPSGFYGYGQSEYYLLQNGLLTGPLPCPTRQRTTTTPTPTPTTTPTPTPTDAGTGGGGELGLGGGTGVPQV